MINNSLFTNALCHCILFENYKVPSNINKNGHLYFVFCNVIYRMNGQTQATDDEQEIFEILI